MATFQNKSFNLVYVHAALQSLVMSGGEGFAFVYLITAGFSVDVVLLCIAAMFLSRIVFRRAVLPLVLRFGLRRVLIAAVLAEGATYLMLPAITSFGPLLILYLALWAISSSFYWTTYHAYVAQVGDSEHRGKQVSAMEFFGMLAGIAGPLAVGMLLTWFNAWVGFGFIALAMLCAALPFAFGPEVEIAREADMPKASLRIARNLLFSDGLRTAAAHFTWLIALFITLGSSFAVFGGALALAGVTGAVMGLFVGKWFDLGKGLRATRIGYGAMALAVVAKSFGFHAPWSAVAAMALGSVAWPSYATAMNAQVYNHAQKSPCTLRFHVVAEGGWDLGTAIGCSFAAIMLHFGFSFFWPLAFGLIGCGLGYWFLTRDDG